MALEQGFFSQIKFDPALLKSVSARYLLNFRLVILLIVVIVLLGGYGFSTLPRRLNPEIKIPIVTISTIFPGASPTDIEQLITIPLEQSIKNLKEIDTYSSVSRDSVSIISIQFVSGKDPDKAKDEVQSAIDSVIIPADSQTPKVKRLDFEDRPVWNFSITSTMDAASFVRFSKALKKNLENGPYTDRVLATGIPDDIISVYINSQKAAELQVSPSLLQSALQSSLQSIPAGTVNTNKNSFSVATPKLIESISDISELPVTIQGKPMRLKDIATIRFGPKSDRTTALFSLPNKLVQNSIVFSVYKTSKANIDTADSSFQKIVSDTLSQYPVNTYSIHTVLNTAEAINEQFTELFGEFRSAIFLVFLILALFLGVRQAFISSLTFPLTFLSTFILMRIAGLSIDFISLFGFLIALGLLIDDTIVTVTAMTRYFGTGNFTGTQTGLLVWRDFIVPLWSTTITTIWAFLPMLLATGIIGEFIKPIPLVVTFNMVSSTSIAVLITLPVMMRIFDKKMPRRVKRFLTIIFAGACAIVLSILIPKTVLFVPTYLIAIVLIYVLFLSRFALSQKISHLLAHPKVNGLISWIRSNSDTGFISIEHMSHIYTRAITNVLQNKSLRRQLFAGIILFSATGFLLLPLGLVKNEFFPKSDSETLYVIGNLGSSIREEEVARVMKKYMKSINATEGVEYFSGQTLVSIGTSGGLQAENGHFTISLRLVKEEKRKLKSYEIAELLRKKFANTNDVEITIAENTSGPPAGADVQIKYSGENLSELETLSNKTMDFLKTQKEVFNIEKSLPTSGSRIAFITNKDELAEVGLNNGQIGFAIRTAVNGFELGKIRVSGEEKDIIFYNFVEKPTPEDLTKIAVSSSVSGPPTPISALGEYRLQTNPSLISREKGKRTLSVSASVKQGSSVSDANKKTLSFAKNSLILPNGYSFSTGGANEENQKSVQSIINAMSLAFILILVTMVLEFNSFRMAFITLCTIPIAVGAVFNVFALTGTALSFPALIGILALFGIVVTTAIVIVEKINENRHNGMDIEPAIIEAAGSRLEPIILTSISTIVGLLPITIADPLWRGLGGAIIAGLLFSGGLKLFFIPIAYKAWIGKEE